LLHRIFVQWKPISSFTVDLGDYSHRLSVSGEAADQVEVISKLVENDLLRHSTAIGGAMFRQSSGDPECTHRHKKVVCDLLRMKRSTSEQH
jgi:hypothetical protein